MSDEQTSNLPRLLAIHGSGLSPERLLLSDDVYTIGRWEHCQIVAPPERSAISRLHAKIERDGPRYLLVDLSANGTWVGERRLEKEAPHVLQDGDQIALADAGYYCLRFVDPMATSLNSSPLSYDERARSFFLEGRLLELTPSQLKLLLHLYRNRGQVCTRESCGLALWGEYDHDMDADRLERTVATLRQRIDAHARGGSEMIEARRGIGYMLRS